MYNAMPSATDARGNDMLRSLRRPVEACRGLSGTHACGMNAAGTSPEYRRMPHECLNKTFMCSSGPIRHEKCTILALLHDFGRHLGR